MFLQSNTRKRKKKDQKQLENDTKIHFFFVFL